MSFLERWRFAFGKSTVDEKKSQSFGRGWLPCFSGFLYAACFAPFNLTWFCWVALTPLIAAIWFSGTESRHRWLRNLLLGYVAGLTFFWIVFSWLTTVTVLGWFVLQFYMAIYFAIWAWFCDLVRPRASTKRQSQRCEQMGPDARSSPRQPTAASAQSPWIKSTPSTGDLLSSSRRPGPRLNGCAAGFSLVLVGMASVSRYTTIGR